MNKGNSKELNSKANLNNFQKNNTTLHTSLQELHNNENDEKKYENMDLKLNILDAILTTAYDCERQGKEITTNLAKQSETLHKIDTEVENINDELCIANSTVDKLKGFFFWTPKKNKLKKELNKRNENLVKHETNKTINTNEETLLTKENNSSDLSSMDLIRVSMNTNDTNYGGCDGEKC